MSLKSSVSFLSSDLKSKTSVVFGQIFEAEFVSTISNILVSYRSGL